MDPAYLQLSSFVLAIFFGVIFFIIAKYTHIPVIVLLLGGGIVLGPEFAGLIQPSSLGHGLNLIISLSVAVILFEGGLTLHPDGVKKASGVILRLLSIGVLVTWLGSAAFIYYILGYPLALSLLAGSLIIVTGPTVITPLLKRLRIKDELNQILHWEAVLIDPIGVFIAILCFEWLSIEGSILTHVAQMGYRFLIGGIIGYAGGKLIAYLLRKELIPENFNNIFVFASALFLYAGSEIALHESGLLTVVISGLVTGWENPPRLKKIQQFKSEITELSIALVFVLLAANLRLDSFFGMEDKVVLVVLAIVFLLRPLGIFLSTVSSKLKVSEKLFLSWLAPRGVVAGSMASLFGLQLMKQGYEHAYFLEAFTFTIIIFTIVVQGGFASLVAKKLDVIEKEKANWLIVGVNLFSLKVAEFISKNSAAECFFIDTNIDAVSMAEKHGFQAFTGNALEIDMVQDISIGKVFALTDNRDLNELICDRWSELIEPESRYRWSPGEAEMGRAHDRKSVAVWTTLKKPSELAYELSSGEIKMHHRQASPQEIDESRELILATSGNGKIEFSGLKDGHNPVHLLTIEKAGHHLQNLLKENHIFFTKALSYRDTLIEILTEVKSSYPDLPHDKIALRLIERETEFPTTMANGIGAPHVFCDDLSDTLCFVIKLSGNLDIQSYDDHPVDILFLLLTPEYETTLHLKLLAEIAKIASDKNMTRSLRDASSKEEILKILSQ